MTSETQYVAMKELSPAHIHPAEYEELCTPAGTHNVIQVHPCRYTHCDTSTHTVIQVHTDRYTH